MKAGPVLFALALLGSAAAWALLVLPALTDAAEAAGTIERTDIEGARKGSAAWPGPTPEQERALAASLASFAPPLATVPLPAGIREGEAGAYEGQIPAGEVQALLAWVASRPESVASVEVNLGAPGKAACRVVLAGRPAK